jgi:hypothetical protein
MEPFLTGFVAGAIVGSITAPIGVKVIEWLVEAAARPMRAIRDRYTWWRLTGQ